MSERNYAIDFVKFFAILSVVCIHAKPLQGIMLTEEIDINFLIDVIARFAVPFFFITTGYLIGQKIFNGANPKIYITEYLWKILKIYISWLFFYIFYDVIIRLFYWIALNDPSRFYEYLSSLFSIRTIVYGPPGTAHHLWYLVSLILAIIILYFAIRLKKILFVVIISYLLTFIGVFGQGYSFMINLSIETRDTIFFSLFYIVTGYLFGNMRSLRDFIGRMKPMHFFCLFLAFNVIQIYEKIVIMNYSNDVSNPNYYITTPFLVISLFVFVLLSPSLGKGSKLSFIGSKTLGIYVIHTFFINTSVLSLELIGYYEIISETILWKLFFTPFVFVISFFSYSWLQALKSKVFVEKSH